MIPLRFNNRCMFFLALAYWITYSASSLPGFKTYLLFLVMIYSIKNSKKYLDKKEERKTYEAYSDNSKKGLDLIEKNIEIC